MGNKMVSQSSTKHIVSTENTVVDSLPGSLNATGSSVLEGSTEQAKLIYKFKVNLAVSGCH